MGVLCPGWRPDGTACSYSDRHASGRTRTTLADRRSRTALADTRVFLVLPRCPIDVHVAFTITGKAVVASSRTDLMACIEGARDGRRVVDSRSEDQWPGADHSVRPSWASSSEAQIFTPWERQPGALVTLPPASSEEMAAEVEQGGGREPKHEIAVVVLTQANRPAELARAIASVQAQEQVDLQLVLVVNGAHPPRTEPSDRLVVLPENVGIPSSRNIGASAADAQLMMFLDDDAELLDTGLLAAVVDRFKADPRLVPWRSA